MTESKYPCICCGYLVMPDFPGSYALCPICGWEDDEAQARDPFYPGGTNSLPLIRAQQEFVEHGSIDPAAGQLVRSPLPDEGRDSGWRPFDPARDVVDANRPRKARSALYYWR